jgi:hypothetical protein
MNYTKIKIPKYLVEMDKHFFCKICKTNIPKINDINSLIKTHKRNQEHRRIVKEIMMAKMKLKKPEPTTLLGKRKDPVNYKGKQISIE